MSARRTVLVFGTAALFLDAANARAATFAPTEEERATAIEQSQQQPNFDLAQLALKTDPQGRRYVQLGDMRFVVTAVQGPESAGTGNLWTNGVVYYVFASNVSTANRTNWRNAAALWRAVATLTFTEGTGHGNYIYVQASSSNDSYIGMIGGRQDMNIVSWSYTYIIAHEIGHALGLIHEHQRTDRGSYVQINIGNIQTQHYSDNFPTMYATVYGAYDFDSVMHYDQCAFSIDCSDGSSCSCTHRTITVLPPYTQWQYLIGQHDHLSQLDRAGMAQRYGPPGGQPAASQYDLNGDGYPDLVTYFAGSRVTTIGYLNNNNLMIYGDGPAIPPGWNSIDLADFNRDGNSDLLLFNQATRRTVIWYVVWGNGVEGGLVGSAYGPTLPVDWIPVRVCDLNRDGKPDYVLYNTSTRRTAIWYLNNNVLTSTAWGPTIPAGWQLIGLADFNSDGNKDYLLCKASTRQTAIWYLNNNTFVSSAYGPTISAGYTMIGAADFNRDGRPDYLLYSSSTARTAIWYLNNNAFVSGLFGPTLPPGSSLIAP